MARNRPRVLVAHWSELPRWDFKTARAAEFRLAHPTFRPLGDYIEEATEIVKPSDEPEKEWPVYGVNNQDGVFFSHNQLGSDFNSSYKRIEKDWFFHNPTRANVGSLGRVPEVPKDAITSPEYQVWRIKEGLLPEYVDLLLKTPLFLDLIDCHRVGAVKERLFVQNLMEIPVPPIQEREQRKIVNVWRESQKQTQESWKTIEEKEVELVEAALKAGKITLVPQKQRPRAYKHSFSEMDRWGVGFNRWTWTLGELLASTFTMTPLADEADINPDISAAQVTSDDMVSFVPMEAVDEIAGEIVRAEVRPYREVSSGYTKFLENDVIWAKITPCMENGKCAVAKFMENRVGCGSTEFHVVRSKDVNRLRPEFIWVILRLAHVRKAAVRYFTGSAGQKRVPADFLGGLEIPVPPPAVQDGVVESVYDARRRIGEMRLEASHRAREAILAAEATILGEARPGK